MYARSFTVDENIVVVLIKSKLVQEHSKLWREWPVTYANVCYANNLF